jgi:cytoskeletal protein RodZ
MNRWNGAFLPLRRYRLLAAFISAVAVLGALALCGWLAHWPASLFSGSVRDVSTARAAAPSEAPASANPASANPASTGPTDTSVPAGAEAAVTGLISQNPTTLSAALAVGYPVSADDVAPVGTTIRVQPGTWQQRGDYATVRAVVTLPGRAPLSETIYFIREEGRWRVLFADPS